MTPHVKARDVKIIDVKIKNKVEMNVHQNICFIWRTTSLPIDYTRDFITEITRETIRSITALVNNSSVDTLFNYGHTRTLVFCANSVICNRVSRSPPKDNHRYGTMVLVKAR